MAALAAAAVAAALGGRRAWRAYVAYSAMADGYDLGLLSRAPETLLVEDRDGFLRGGSYENERFWIEIGELPAHAWGAFVAAEDRRFFGHRGWDPRGVARAAWNNIRGGGSLQGGSTITQQLAKLLIGRSERTLERKAVEVLVARRIERRHSKRDILGWYLNHIYLGEGCFGIEAAAQGYFGVPASALTVPQAAMLAGLVPSPSRYSPRRDPRTAEARMRIVLRAMRETGAAPGADPGAAALPPIMPPGRIPGINDHAAAEAVRAMAEAMSAGQIPMASTYRIRTTIDTAAQERCEVAVMRHVTKIRQYTGLPVEAAVLLADHWTGEVLALVGGHSFAESQFNRATMARREGGCILAAPLAARALARGWTPCSPVDASPLEMTGRRRLPLQDAVALSDRWAYRRLCLEFAPSEARWDAQPLSLAEVWSAFAPIGSDGQLRPPRLLVSVTDYGRRELLKAVAAPPARMLAPQTAAMARALLLNGSRDGFSGMLDARDICGAGALSVGNRDIWYAGSSSNRTAVVWVGCDESMPVASTADAAKMAFPIWRDAIGPYSAPPAEGLETVLVGRQSGGVIRRPYAGPAMAGALRVSVPPAWAGAIAARGARPPGGDWQAQAAAAAVPSAAMALRRGLLACALSGSREPGDGRVEGIWMPGIRGDIVTSDGERVAETVLSWRPALHWPPEGGFDGSESMAAWMQRQAAAGGIRGQLSAFEAACRERRHLPLVLGAKPGPDAGLPPGLTVRWPEPARNYLHPDLYCHIVGHASAEARPRRTGPPRADDVLYPRFVGRSGIEAACEATLAGADGYLSIVTDDMGGPCRAAVARPAGRGGALRLSILHRWQEAAGAALARSGLRGAVVMVEADTGLVRAMVSAPGYDPGALSLGLDPSRWRWLAADPGRPLVNRAAQSHAPPGSTFKVLTALAAMRSGRLSPSDRIELGSLTVGGVSFAFPSEQGEASLEGALRRSLNSYFMRVGLRVGAGPVTALARDLGLGRGTGWPLPEVPGCVPDDAHMREHHGRPLCPGDMANISIGQGDLLVTPLQMALLMGALCNGGTLYAPAILEGGGRGARGRVEFGRELGAVRGAMREVVEAGTGWRAQREGFDVHGKTGTAQAPPPATLIGWFCGWFTPPGERALAFAVMVEGDGTIEGFSGGASAAPVLAAALEARRPAPPRAELVRLPGPGESFPEEPPPPREIPAQIDIAPAENP